MAVTRERKLEVARRSYTLLTEKYGMPRRGHLFDPLVFPCGTGDEKYVGQRATRRSRASGSSRASSRRRRPSSASPTCRFGLPDAGREVLNSVFLYHCTKAGLDLAIVNTEKLERYPSIPEEERRLAEDLIYNRGRRIPVAAFAAYFRGQGRRAQGAEGRAPAARTSGLPRYILEGRKDGLVDDLEAVRDGRHGAARHHQRPADDGHGRGRPAVQRQRADRRRGAAGAEAMKAAVSHLEQYMEKAERLARAR